MEKVQGTAYSGSDFIIIVIKHVLTLYNVIVLSNCHPVLQPATGLDECRFYA